MIGIVKTLKEFWTVLLRQQLKILTYHKNLTCKNFNTDRLSQWILILQKYIPDIEYILENKNKAADDLLRLPDEGISKDYTWVHLHNVSHSKTLQHRRTYGRQVSIIFKKNHYQWKETILLAKT